MMEVALYYIAICGVVCFGFMYVTFKRLAYITYGLNNHKCNLYSLVVDEIKENNDLNVLSFTGSHIRYSSQLSKIETHINTVNKLFVTMILFAPFFYIVDALCLEFAYYYTSIMCKLIYAIGYIITIWGLAQYPNNIVVGTYYNEMGEIASAIIKLTLLDYKIKLIDYSDPMIKSKQSDNVDYDNIRELMWNQHRDDILNAANISEILTISSYLFDTFVYRKLDNIALKYAIIHIYENQAFMHRYLIMGIYSRLKNVNLDYSTDQLLLEPRFMEYIEEYASMLKEKNIETAYIELVDRFRDNNVHDFAKLLENLQNQCLKSALKASADHFGGRLFIENLIRYHTLNIYTREEFRNHLRKFIKTVKVEDLYNITQDELDSVVLINELEPSSDTQSDTSNTQSDTSEAIVYKASNDVDTIIKKEDTNLITIDDLVEVDSPEDSKTTSEDSKVKSE